MRPIKFRAWDKALKTMYVAHSFMVYADGSVHLDSGWNDRHCGEKVDEGRLSLMQFTGLLDKNGKEIYEGDIVKLYGMPEVVEFQEGGFGVKSQLDFQYFGVAMAHEYEVIGNIHENPEPV